MKFILGKKIEMTQLFNEKGKVKPVTLIEAGPCFITQIKTKEKDGYETIQIGFEKKKKGIKKTEKEKEYKYLKEFRILDSSSEMRKVGDKIDISIFKEGEKVKISGISKGKGFAGAVKKWGFSGRNASHGAKHEERTLGSVGSTDPERVFKGKKMPGRMGGERTTIKNLEIVKIDPENNLIAIKGAIPGRKGTLLEIKHL
ncbi:50S ribosomal protein L3 [bacterium (Candidatus Gribaldobacteria) CG07_land_8_20_14_0_80_33_18]|uniref:Large ribosomal subunit protein uL3 n=1 Tax=bacterium (Candidatus Gribaldobacteria) CG07_land_8_20_14_0_80_33_18 TaxID=2014272 RepID=A0A2M6Z2W2_9BACT|nr:MAG: 50S ribosomal protein L3 [bacterium (Candidatus Gribaldobacteria) CG10_big_fil_rev_8_21_14_0_10_33_41]PIU46720.1 MAG: 50S ribosomal protein L3 [bacterium (Candidatus Gribaldobacteria) CG07_land_8_20_14_0_80_33_18]PJA00551.1 MAG: 50S ribosomal protein L3 [bacterium (Candidatus Gribaldobacteria) CG_4_10_14_0_2_um_filter_33_15]PJB08905.1 MAG: 50S ribosomal protein L3 [bacterium (Candidatus Gribaldobacteria) CG_4_9_14_3_um_filter_33_9]